MKLNERQACQLLGLAAPTTLDKARKAYRKLAQEFHPDRGGDEERFKQISVAYQYLVDFYEARDQEGRGNAKPATSQSNKTKTSRTKTSTSNQKNTQQSRSTKKHKSRANKAKEDADHRQAWRDWRDQVERGTESKHKKRGSSPPRDRYEKSQTQSTQSDRGEQTKPHSSTPESHSTSEIVEAAVVPTFGDTLRRWSEGMGDRISEATEGLGQRLGKWYRKGARPLFEKGTDEKLRLNIDLTTSLHGKQVRIGIQRLVACSTCQVVDGVLRRDPQISAAQWAEGCQSCHETGRVMHREELSVYIPPGADKGNKLKVNDKGSAGLNGAIDGDLYLILTPEELPQGFRRNGSDVELTQAVSTALLSRGGVLPIKTLRGSLNIKVPSNFQSGKKLLIPEQGFPIWSDPEKIGKLTVCLRAIRLS